MSIVKLVFFNIVIAGVVIAGVVVAGSCCCRGTLFQLGLSSPQVVVEGTPNVTRS
jgi:hypothetical protein